MFVSPLESAVAVPGVPCRPAAAGEGGDGPALSSASHLRLDLAAGGCESP